MISTRYVLMLLSLFFIHSEVSGLWGNHHTDNVISLSHAQIWTDPTHLQYTEFSLLRTLVLHPT